MSLTPHGHCSCSIASALLREHICSGCKASTREIPPGRQRLRTSRWCSASAGGFPSTLRLWDVWKLFTTATEPMLSVECAFCIFPAWLAPSAPSTAASPPCSESSSVPKQPPAEHPTAHSYLSDQSLTICVTSVRGVLAQSWGHTAPRCSSAGWMCTKLPSVPPALSDPFSQCLPQMSQPVLVQNEQGLKSSLHSLSDPGLSHAQWRAAFRDNFKLSLSIFPAHFGN